MDLKDIYLIEEDFSRKKAARVAIVNHALRGHYMALSRGEWSPDELLRFKQCEGTRWFDYVGTTSATVSIVSVRLFDVFESAGLTGWDSLPVEITDNKGIVVPGYRIITVKGRCGPIDNSRSIPFHKVISGNPRGAKAWKGLYFDELSWDGSDFFSPGNTAFMFVTSRTKELLEREKATNMTIHSLADIERLNSLVEIMEKNK